MVFFAMSGARAGTITGMKVKDAVFEIFDVRTAVRVGSADRSETVDRGALVTE